MSYVDPVREARADTRAEVLEEIAALMDDLDRGVIDLAELRAEVERRALSARHDP